MKQEYPWLFTGLFERSTKIGVLLEGASRRVSLEKIDDPHEQRIVIVRELGAMVGCEIKPLDFIALGPDYLRTEAGKAVAHRLEIYLSRLEKRISS